MRRKVARHMEYVGPLVLIIVVLGIVVRPACFPICCTVSRTACIRHW